MVALRERLGLAKVADIGEHPPQDLLVAYLEVRRLVWETLKDRSIFLAGRRHAFGPVQPPRMETFFRGQKPSIQGLILPIRDEV